MSGMKASPWGARLMALPSASRCLGAYVLRPSLGRHASSGSARLLAAMQDILVSLHSIRSRSTNFWLHHQPTTNIATSAATHRRLLHSTYPSRPCRVSSDTGHYCLRPLRGRHTYKSLLEVGPARLLATMLGDLGVSTLRIKTMTQFSSLFGASNQSYCLLQWSGTTLRVCLQHPHVFLVVSTCWETCFSSRCHSTYLFLFLSFLTIIPVILPAMMLGYYS
jgi:hypothetical protein